MAYANATLQQNLSVAASSTLYLAPPAGEVHQLLDVNTGIAVVMTGASGVNRYGPNPFQYHVAKNFGKKLLYTSAVKLGFSNTGTAAVTVPWLWTRRVDDILPDLKVFEVADLARLPDPPAGKAYLIFFYLFAGTSCYLTDGVNNSLSPFEYSYEWNVTSTSQHTAVNPLIVVAGCTIYMNGGNGIFMCVEIPDTECKSFATMPAASTTVYSPTVPAGESWLLQAIPGSEITTYLENTGAGAESINITYSNRIQKYSIPIKAGWRLKFVVGATPYLITALMHNVTA